MKQDLGFSGSPKEKMLFILVNRTVIFFFLMCCFALLLYAAGTVQNFTDSTQLNLLWLSGALGILLAVTSICGMALGIYRFKKYKNYILLRASGYLLLVIFAVVVVFVVMAIMALSSGTGVE